jgi:hypothetical protein
MTERSSANAGEVIIVVAIAALRKNLFIEVTQGLHRGRCIERCPEWERARGKDQRNALLITLIIEPKLRIATAQDALRSPPKCWCDGVLFLWWPFRTETSL